MSADSMSRQHPSNKRTALALAALALAFFVAIVFKYWWSK